MNWMVSAALATPGEVPRHAGHPPQAYSPGGGAPLPEAAGGGRWTGVWRGRAPLRGIAGGGRAGACRRRRTLVPCLLAALLPALTALCSPPFIYHPGHLQRCARHIGPSVRKMSEKFPFSMGNFKNRLAETKRTPSVAPPLASPPGPQRAHRAPPRTPLRGPMLIAAAAGGRRPPPAHRCVPPSPPPLLDPRPRLPRSSQPRRAPGGRATYAAPPATHPSPGTPAHP